MKNLKISIALSCLIMLAACKKDDDNPSGSTPVSTNPITISKFMADRAPKKQSFSFQTETGGSFTTSKGMVIKVPGSSIVNENNKLIKGTVELIVKEVFTKSEMIYSEKYPLSNNELLSSDGQFFIGFDQNNQTLRLKDGAVLDVTVPSDDINSDMQLFFGGPNIDRDQLNWNLGDTIRSVFNITNNNQQYQLKFDSLGWVNLDVFVNVTNYYGGTFKLKGLTGMDGSNTRYYYISKDYNAVWPAYTSQIISQEITETKMPGISTNMLVVSVIDNTMYVGQLEFDPINNFQFNVNMKVTTPEQLELIMKKLDD